LDAFDLGEGHMSRKFGFAYKPRFLVVACLALSFASAPRVAAGIIIDGTDANDHGSASGSTNQSGWKYMESVLTALAGSNNMSTAKVLVDLGTSTGTARNAIASAFNLGPLPGQGWTIQHIDGAAAIAAHLSALSPTTTGILYIPSYNNSSGDLTKAEMDAINAGAAQIDAFTAAGGSLFAMAQSNSGANTGAYGWLTTLVPGLIFTDIGTGGFSSNITLTVDGMAAFPGLTNADLAGADPWHVHFSGNFGGLDILGTAQQNAQTRNIILGNVQGALSAPVPEPTSLALFGMVSLAGYAGWRRRKQ